MKKQNDSRITASSITFKQFLVMFGIILLICSNYHILYIRYLEIYNPNRELLTIVVVGLLIALSFLGTILMNLFKGSYFDKPIKVIADAARKVAEGDFDLSISHRRKDGKKDYIEVLIDDFNRMVEELRTIQTLKTNFIANVSHEIKTPLAVIQSYATVIQQSDLSNDERHEYGKAIIESSKKLTELVTNILKLNKLENQEITPIKETYALDEQIRECVLNYEEIWDKKGITFIGDDIDAVMVNYDKSLLELVWNNLISNAIKFTDSDGVIIITLKKHDEQAIVSIKDTGQGMSEETIAHMFDRFYQGDESHTTEGNGLGMALVKRVMALVDGDIYVESQINVGSTITVRLKI